MEREILAGKWDEVPPIWITPNFILNGLFNIMYYEWHPTLKPFIIYNGHHRFSKALKHNLLVRAYVRYTPGNPQLPSDEELSFFY